MRKLTYFLIWLFVLTTSAIADKIQVPIPPEACVRNNGGNCAWCSLETLGNYQNIEALKGLTRREDCKGIAPINKIVWVLNSLRVQFRLNPEGIKTQGAIDEFLVKPCSGGRGVAVCLRDSTWFHMLVVVHYDISTKTVMVIDNSGETVLPTKVDWDWFHRVWTGTAVVLENEKFY